MTRILSALLFLVPVATASAAGIDFARDIRPILSENCFQCHGPDEAHREADLRLDLREAVFAERDGVTLVQPGNPDASELWYRITTEDELDLMPPPDSHKSLSPVERQRIRRWIEGGAEWTDHWSFVPPAKTPVPGGVSPIDHFVQERARSAGLDPSPKADPHTLIRRLSFDLTGLPPTPAQVNEFREVYHKDSARALHELVERLLASPHYGERMAVMWLDAARYGDTSVMHADGPRDMWAWRDWIVAAYNRNQPFDRFSIEQLAGDLIPNATLDQKIASGFNRNHATSDEGGAIPEELRVSYVVDRVQTTANVWMGLTMECGQCHDHKYDPISQREYYEFYAFFNNHADPGMQTRRGNEEPVVAVVDSGEEKRLRQVRKTLESAGEALQRIRREEASALETWLRPLESEGPAETGGEPDGLAHLFACEEPSRDFVTDFVTGRAGLFEGPKQPESGTKPPRRGLEFDGDTAVTVRGFPDYDSRGNPFTFAAWLKVPAGASGAVFSDMDVKSKHRGYDLWLQGGRVGTHLVNAWPKKAIKVVSQEKLTPDRWHHVVITYGGTNKAAGVRIFIDGKPAEVEVQKDSLRGSTKSNAPFRIGARSPNGHFKGQVDDIRIYRRVLEPDELARTSRDPVETARATPAERRSPVQKKILRQAYFSTQSAPYRAARAKRLRAREAERSIVESRPTTMVMGDRPAGEMRPTYLLDRGAYDAPVEDEVLQPGVPAVLPPLSTEAPRNRLGLANWLFRDNHPLTARVAVNQIWQIFFGSGLVETPGDFGAQGAFPTHPALLDWLAVDFQQHGWDVKRLVRQIVTSHTYLQSSHLRPRDRELDPENRLLARAPRFRLQAEFLRDNALAVSGLLNREMGGPGVKPYQPPGLWAEVALGGKPKFVQDEGDELYRRSLYTYWKRSAPPPNMQAFDAPTREQCVLQRPRTNTPLQALVTLNDVQFVEAARHLAELMMRSGDQPATIAEAGFERVTARPPQPGERKALLSVYRESLAHYRSSPEAADALLSHGDSAQNPDLPKPDHAAWTVVASALLNLDETMTRE